ncbi:pentatricopeptide repeat-containing protein At5g39710 [Rutidosis leptorrhynchoides]|uniref:pentatricopeptide repeat-containing protein At5g39710 n=1 Tax=Rutidosis leptorrhynchoides TaxID=125765 RepID=UPI003A9999E9
MNLLKPYRKTLRFSTLIQLPSPEPDVNLVVKAIAIIKRHHIRNLDSLSSQFTPQSASYLLYNSQFDKTLIVTFINWARKHPFFDLRCSCQSLHILTRFKLYKSAQTIAEAVAINTPNDENGDLVFSCLKDTYSDCNSSSAVIDLLVKAYSSLKLVKRGLNTIHLAVSHGFMPGVLSYNSVLDAIIRSNEPIKIAEEMFLNMIKIGVSPNVFTYNILIRGFCGVKELEKGLGFFAEMQKNGCLPNVVTYNTLIDAYCKLRRLDDAFKLFKTMSTRMLEPNLISYNVILNGLGREGRMKETSEVLEDMKRKRIVPDEVTYNTLVNGYCKEGNFHQALVLHDEMTSNGLSPNVITYTSLINSMCKARNLHRAMALLEQMRIRKLFPNARTYTTLIDGFSQQGFMDEAYKLLDEMKRNGFSPSIVTYNALIHGHTVDGNIEGALKVLDQISITGLVPDVVSYSTIITGFCRNQDLDKAFEMKRQMVKNGVLPDAVTYSSLIKGLCDQRKLTEACDVFQEMLRIGLPPDECTYTALINAYCVEGDTKNALDLHDEMLNKGLLPDVVTYNVLINGLSKQARTREAKQILFKLYYDNAVPDDVTYNTLIDNCGNMELKSVVALIKGFCMKGLMNEADKVFDKMLEKQQTMPSESVYNVMIHGHCKGGNLRKSFDLYKKMVNHGFIPHSATIIALVKELIKGEMHVESSEVIENVLRSCKLSDGEVAKALVEINHKQGNMDAVFKILAEMAKDGLLPNSGRTAYAQ